METEKIKGLESYSKQLRQNTFAKLNNQNVEQAVIRSPETVQPTTEKDSSDTTFENVGEFVERTGATLLDVVGNVIQGCAQSLEGVYDMGASLVGTVGGWFSDEFEQSVEEHVAYDAMGEAFSWLDEATADSFINEMGETGQNIIRGVAQGVGGMLPAIAVTVATGGVGAPAMVGKVASGLVFGMGAGGQSAEEAVQQGADLSNATAYGIASGALETGVEAVSGFVPWGSVTKSTGKVLGKEVAKSTAGKALTQFVSEGAEEVASDLLNPSLKRLTKVDEDAKVDVSELPETFVIGGLTGVTMGGAGRVASNLKYHKQGGSKFVNIANEIDAIRENEVKLAKAQANTKYTEEQIKEYTSRVDTDKYESLENISSNLKAMKTDQRAEAFKLAPDLAQIFDADGNINEATKQNFANVSNLNVSSNVRHRTNALADTLARINKTHGTTFELDTDTLNTQERTNFAKVTNALGRLVNNSKYSAGLDVALVKTNKDAKAFVDNGVLFVGKDQLGNGDWAKAVIHEVTHFTEGSKEYNELAQFLTSDSKTANRIAREVSNKAYGYTYDEIRSVLSKVKAGEKLSKRHGEIYTEVVAHMAEELLGTESSINNIATKNEGVAKRIYERIKSFIKAIKDTNANKETVARLQEAEKHFAKALGVVGKPSNVRNLIEINDNNEILLNFGTQFNRKTWEDSGKAETIKALKKNGFEQQEIDQKIGEMEEILDLIGAFTKGDDFKVLKQKFDMTPMLTTYNGRQVFSVLVGNGDYVVNFDLSTECKKREYYAKVIEQLADEGYFEKTAFDKDDISAIQMIMRQDGYEMPCFMCFVENRRQYMREWAVSLTDTWNNIVKEKFGENFNKKYNFAKGNLDADVRNLIEENYFKVSQEYKLNSKGDVSISQANIEGKMRKIIDTMDENTVMLLQASDLVTEEGVKNLKANLYNVYSIASSSYGAGTPKIAKGFTPYNSEVLKLTPSYVKQVLGKTLSLSNYKQNGKAIRGDEETRRAIRAMLYDIGGGRFQSFSDAQIEEVFDILQLVLDFSANKYPMHYYSKELWEHRLLGLTGAKANGSLISTVDNNTDKALAGLRELKGDEVSSTGIEISLAVDDKGKVMLDENGLPKQATENQKSKRYTVEFADYQNNRTITTRDKYTGKDYTFAVTHSIGYKDAVALQNLDGYSSNFGTIAIGFSDAHIIAMLDSPFIRMVIPYHASGMIKAFAQELQIDGLNDYTGDQTNKANVISFTVDGKEGTQLPSEVKAKLKMDFLWNKELQTTKDVNQAVNNYLAYCDKTHTQTVTINGKKYVVKYNITPKFARFRNHPNYYKLLTDFNVKDCITEGVALQGDVQFKLPKANSYTNEQVQAYKDRLMATGIFTQAEVENYAKKTQLGATDIIKKQISYSENYRSVQDAKFNKTMDNIHEHFDARYGKQTRFSLKDSDGTTTDSTPTEVKPQEQTKTQILTEIPTEKPTFRGKVSDFWTNFQIHFSDESMGIIKEAQRLGDENIEAMVHFARASYNAGQSMLKNEQRDAGGNVVGKSFKDIWKPIHDKGNEYTSDFYSYLMHFQNIDRTAQGKEVLALDENNLSPDSVFIKEFKDYNKFVNNEVQVNKLTLLKDQLTTLKSIKDEITAKQNTATNQELNALTQKLKTMQRKIVRNWLPYKLDSNGKEKKTGLPKNTFTLITRAIYNNLSDSTFNNILNDIDTRTEKLTKAQSKILVGSSVAKEILEKTATKIKKNNYTTAQAKDFVELQKNATIHRIESTIEIQALEKAHPEFKQIAEEVWKYNDNLLQLRVDMNLITQEVADYMRATYPHYVPTNRVKVGTQNLDKQNVKVKVTVKRATGSTLDILPPDVIIARQTMAVMRAGRVNMLANQLYDGVISANDFTNVSVAEKEIVWKLGLDKQSRKAMEEANEKLLELMDDDYIEASKKPNQVTFFKNREKITLNVTPEIYAGFEAFAPNVEYQNKLINLVTGANSTFKKLVTSANPFFLVRNFFRDLQEALFYTKGTKNFARNLGKAFTEIKNNGEMWRLYLSAGGLSSGLFDYNTGIKQEPKNKGVAIAKKVADKLEYANMVVEQLPRLAEFMNSMQNGATVQQALLDSADVTTNFSRSGKTSKFLNRTIMPFLNPSIQGWSKFVRTVFSKKSAQEWGALILKALILGIGLTAINDLLNGDDEDYESIPIYTKENYYLFKVGDTFLKIPKGRVLSIFGSLWLRAKETAKGNENAWDGYISSVASAVSPVDNFSRTIFSPITDATTNTTWYGGEIEGREFDNVAPENRYDEKTSVLAVGIGKVLPISPKKIHYVIDQYSGIIGDVILPMTTPQAERSVIASNFTVDATLSSRYTGDFYDTLDRYNYKKSEGDINANYIVRYLNSVAGEVSDMYATKDEIQNSDKKNSEKMDEVKVVQTLINTTNKSAIANVKQLENVLNEVNVDALNKKLKGSKAYAQADEKTQQKAIQKLNDYYYQVVLNQALGVTMDGKYEYLEGLDVDVFITLSTISTFTADKDKAGNSISGSKKAKIVDYLKKLNYSSADRNKILNFLGYSAE